MHKCAALTIGLLTLVTGACAAQQPTAQTALPVVQEAPSPALDALFQEYDAAQLAASPQGKAYRGVRDSDYGRWDDMSSEADAQADQRLQDAAARMRREFDPANLADADALSFRLFDALAQRRASLLPYRTYGYLFDQMNGAQSGLPAFLINIHRVSNHDEAYAYIDRIEGLGAALDTLTAESRSRADKGIMPPKWVYSYVISDIENLLDKDGENPVLKDFSNKAAGAGFGSAEVASFNVAADLAWGESARPAYQRLLAEMQRQQAIAPTDDGVWRLPDGDKYYAALLASYTTTDLTADQIHDLGLSEVARIHGEMRGIMAQVGFSGSLQEFFAFTRTDPRFYHTTREGYLADAARYMAAMEAKLPEYFTSLPKDPLVIKPVEAFREQSAGKAFYQSPAPDGSRPGTYYVNLYTLADMSKNELEALAYHEGVPGHHLQRSIQTGLGELPPFRRFGGVTVYSEGWGLYSEELSKDMGFYTDPYSDFGRLGMELWRAGRLVVDTGLHHKRWSRERAIQYLADNTPNPEGDIRKAIERYVVYPGQATAYTIGKLKIMELRALSRAELGERFDIRAFHEVILASGPVPLDVMEANVRAWIAQRKAS